MKSLTATQKLTVAYLAILMTISIAFSAVVYHTSVASLEEGFLQQARFFQGQPGFGPRGGPPQLNQIRFEQLDEGKQHIFINLLGINVAILVLGGLGSYWLAQRTLRPIEEALDAQSRFTADASHELRTPLTAMQTEIEVALRDKHLKMGEAKKLLHSNLEEIEKLRALASGLLTLSRYQSGEQVVFKTVVLNDAAIEAKKRLGPTIKVRGANIIISGEKVEVQGELESITSLLVILLDNAIKYSNDKPQVNLVITQENRQGVIKVSDKGIGIKASDIPLIFNRFFRADSSRSKATAGYGLGLSIAKQIVEIHNGTIAVESLRDNGTTITIKIPTTQPTSFLPV